MAATGFLIDMNSQSRPLTLNWSLSLNLTRKKVRYKFDNTDLAMHVAYGEGATALHIAAGQGNVSCCECV